MLDPQTLKTLLALDVPLHLGTLDSRGFPRVTPLWFVFEAGAFYMTSIVGKRHVRDLERDPRASVRVDVEASAARSGVRANAQVGGRGRADLRRDGAAEWTRRITLKYVSGADGRERAERRAQQDRVLIVLVPEHLEAIGTSHGPDVLQRSRD